MKTFLVIAFAFVSASAFAAACRDGEVQYFPLNGAPGAEGQQEVPVVCKGGVFFAPSAPVTNASCREGQTETWSTGGGEGEPVHTATYVCHGGRYIEVGAAPVSPSPAYGCQEGRKEYFVVGGGEGEPVRTEVFVCHNNRLHRIK